MNMMIHEAMIVKPKVMLRLQKVREVRMWIICWGKSQAVKKTWRKSTWASTGKAIVVVLSNHHWSPHLATTWLEYWELQVAMFSLLDFNLAFFPFFSVWFLHFGMEMFTLYDYTLEVLKFIFDFYRCSQLSLTTISEETLDLDFSAVLVQLRLWWFLGMEKIDFT